MILKFGIGPELLAILEKLALETGKQRAEFYMWAMPERNATRLTLSWLSKTGQPYSLSELIDDRLIRNSMVGYGLLTDSARSLAKRCAATPDPEPIRTTAATFSSMRAWTSADAADGPPTSFASTQMSGWNFTSYADNINTESAPIAPAEPPKPEPLPEGCLAPRLPPSFDPLKPDGESLATAYIPRKQEAA